jgi:hypothetical protein
LLIIENANSIDWEGSSWENINVIELLNFIRNAENINQIKLSLKDNNKLKISEESFYSFDEIKSRFNAGELLSFQIPINIIKNRSTPDRSFFDVYVQKVPHLKRSEELYIRSGINIPEEREKMRNRPVRGIFVAQERSISEFLGDCENPAHTKWNERTEGFKDKYYETAKTLRFIRNGMADIVSILDQPPQEIQKDFLNNIFSIPIENQNEEDKEKDKEKGNKKTDKDNESGTVVLPKNIIKQPSLFKVTKSKGGFKVSLNDDKALLPIKLKIRVAYDIRNGDPFEKYTLFDFDLNKLIIESTGCSIDNMLSNEMEIRIKSQDFSIEINGFDLNRDLIIDIHGGRNRHEA